jgi:hypothetical protein
VSVDHYSLVLLPTGGATLERAGKVVWASDSDEEFQEEFEGHDLFDESDAVEILDYLVEIGQLTDDQADDAEIAVESFTPGSEDIK